MGKGYRLVLFDVDKTLLMGSKVHFNALIKAVSEVYGIKNPAKIENLQGMTDLKIIYTILNVEHVDTKTIKSRLHECMTLMSVYFDRALKKTGLTVLAGVVDLLNELQSCNVPMGLVTGNMEDIAWLKLDKVGLRDYFQFGGFGDYAMERINLVGKAIDEAENLYGKLNRENIFVIGDTPRDIVSGQKLGVKTIAVATGDFNVHELQMIEPDFVLENLKDTTRVVDIILGRDESLN